MKFLKLLRDSLLSLFLIVSSVCLNSCKKQELSSQKTDPALLEKIASYSNNPKIQETTIAIFLNSINLNDLGVLRTSVVAGRERIMTISPLTNLHDYDLDKENIKLIDIGGTQSFVFAIKQKKQSNIFQNLTIEKNKDGLKAFISTYTPTAAWVEKYRLNKFEPFDGDIVFTKVNLDGQTLPSLKIKSIIKSRQLSSLGPMKTVSTVVTTCASYSVLKKQAYICAAGLHWPWQADDCDFAATGFPEKMPGYTTYTVEKTVCTVIALDEGTTGAPGGSTPGGGTGGTTTPNLPPDYTPCEAGVQCDVISGGPNAVNALKIENLISVLSLQGNEASFVTNNEAFGTGLYDLTAAENFSYESIIAGKLTVKAVESNMMATADDNAYYQMFIGVVPEASLVDPGTSLRIYFSFQCAILRAEHHDWPAWKIYAEASKEMVHLVLDGIGLIPGGGEIADLANGAIYTIEGDAVNAAFSYTSAIPFVGWFSMGAKFAKRTITLTNGTKTTLQWVRKAGNLVSFGDRGQLRKVLNLLPGDARQAHHIIPWGKQAHHAIQKAAKVNGKNPFHMNDVLNGIPLNNSVHLGSHTHYDDLVQSYLNAIPSNATPQQAYDAVTTLIGNIKTAIHNNPGVHINQLNF